MRINIQMQTINGYKKYPVEAYPVLEKYGYKFAAHRGLFVKRTGLLCGCNRNDWRVSEIETGALVTKHVSFYGAVLNAERILQNKTKKEINKAIEKARTEAQPG